MAPRPRRTRAALILFATVVLAAILGATALSLRPAADPVVAPPPDTDAPLLVYAEFGPAADRIFTSPADDPARRTLIETVEHAPGWGINPAPEPAGTLIAYNVLGPRSAARRDSPAELWILDLSTDNRTRLARDADLLVAPRFRDDGQALVYRRSSGTGTQSIVEVDLQTSVRRVLHEEETSFGIFPLGFDAGGDLLFARLSVGGTDVYRVDGEGDAEHLFHASDGIARDWRLSPDRRSVSFLAPEVIAERVVYRVHITSLDEAERSPAGVGKDAREQYGPVWTPDGSAIVFGQEARTSSAEAAALLEMNGELRTLPAPERGFDVPLAWSVDGGYLAVRSFDGRNSSEPGNESIVVVEPGAGRRVPVPATGELIFIGWIGRV